MHYYSYQKKTDQTNPTIADFLDGLTVYSHINSQLNICRERKKALWIIYLEIRLQKLKKLSTDDENFVVATLYKTPDSVKHLIRNRKNTLQKIKSLLMSHSPSYSSNRLIAPQIPTLIQNNSQIHIKPVALQSLHCKRLLPLALQLTHHNSTLNPHINTPFASQKLTTILKPQIVSKIPSLNKSYSNNKFVAIALQKSDNKECEQSEQ